MIYDVFISYSSKDQKVAEGVCGFLESNGIRCFVAYRDIPPGVVWAGAIADGLDGSSMMVTIFSKDFNMSPQVDREIELAANDKKPILTFRISDDIMTGAKKYYLQNLHWLDAFPEPEKSFGALLSNVRLLLGKQESAFVPPVSNNASTSSDISTKQTITYDDGTYVGDVVNGKRHGYGVKTYNNGDKYEGNWVNDKLNGQGKYTWPSGSVYEGDFVDGAQTGKGKYTWPNGEVYEGDFVDGKFDGYGIVYLTDDRIQKGYWKKGDYIGEKPE